MASITVVFGLILSALGVGAWAWSGPTLEHATALIPAAFGVILIILGVLARKDKLRMHVMHAAVVIGLAGFLVPAVMAVPKVPALIQTGRVFRDKDGSDATFATLVQLAMAVICLVFVALCVQSFIAARRARKAAAK